MAKLVDDRQVSDIDIHSIAYKPNVKRIVSVDGKEEVSYVVLLIMTYWLLDVDGNRLVKKRRRHDLFPLPSPVTGIVFINNISVLAPLVRTAAIADRLELAGQ